MSDSVRQTGRCSSLAAALTALSLLSSGCIKLDLFLFNSTEVSLEDYDFTSDELDGIDPSRITSEMIPSGDGDERIHVIYVERDPSKLDPRIDPDRGVTVVFNHGNYHSMLMYWYRVGYFEDLGFNVLIYDYRGYGASEGETTEANLYQDAETAYDYAREQEDVGDILSVGYSLGGGPATWLCSPDSEREVLACFTEAVWSSTQALLDTSAGYDLPSTWIVSSDIDNAERASRFEIPYMMMHGTNDQTIDVSSAHQIWSEARGRHPLNRRYIIDGAGHNNVPVPSYDVPDEPREYSYPDEMPDDLRRELRLYQDRINDFVADAIEASSRR